MCRMRKDPRRRSKSLDAVGERGGGKRGKVTGGILEPKIMVDLG